MSKLRLLPPVLFASLALVAATALAPVGPRPHARAARLDPEPPLRALIVGGGPDARHTQAAIESNVRYAERLLPKGTAKRVLFADGKPETKVVQYLDERGSERYRATLLHDVDGPARPATLNTEFERLGESAKSDQKTPILLYFTGHGGPDPEGQYVDNTYALWGDTDITVSRLGQKLALLPKKAPVVVVMVQCYSGAFGNLIFQDGDPKAPLSDRSVCGFFASVAQRMAAGCTPNVNEEDYHDFTGEFLAALTGTDRMGRPVTGVDYNHDGKVGMNEAFAYALIHEESIDTPVCTSDVFLRRFETTPDKTVFQEKYSDVLSWATPAQSAALSALSQSLHLAGDDRLITAYDRFRNMNPYSEEMRDVRDIRFVRLAKSVVLAHQLMTSPDEDLKHRYEALVQAESQNPFRPK